MADNFTVTNDGLEIVANRLKGTGNEPKYIAWGTGVTIASATDTALETALPEARINGTSSIVTTNTTNDTYQVVGTLTKATASANVTEVILNDATTSGNTFVRGTFSPIGVSIGDSVQFTIKTVFDQA